MTDLEALLDRLSRYGTARNRDSDGELRTISITDDEALLLLGLLRSLGYPLAKHAIRLQATQE